MDFHEVLLKLRSERKLTQSEVAQAVHISPSAMSKYETGRSFPEFDTLLKLADFYDVNIDYLLGRTTIKTNIKELESKLKTRDGTLLPIDMFFRLHEEDKEVVALLLHSYMTKEEYRKK